MGPTGVLERRAGAARPSRPSERAGRRRALARRALSVLVVVAATLLGSYGALVTFTQVKRLSVGEIRLSMSPGHRGALDIYVPLVDWGARFEAIRLPARLRVDLRTVDRTTVTRVASGASLDVEHVRTEARDAIAGYLKALIGVCVAAGFALGLLMAFAIRSRTGPRLRVTSAVAAGTAIAIGIALVILLPPRGTIDSPQYYAHGGDIPRALQALDAAERSSGVLDEELDAQLVGLARLVIAPGNRPALTGRPHITMASDLHNNVLAVPVLQRTAGDGPLLFPGDLTDRGSPLEARAIRQVVRAGKPFVFVSGNHDSDTLVRELVRAGAIVLTQFGRLNRDGSYGNIVQNVGGLRIAGYSDPFERSAAQNFRDVFNGGAPTPAMQDEFTAWLRRVQGNVDIVMVHEPSLIQPALQVLRDDPPSHPIVFVTGHTHKATLDRQPGVTVINDGSIGAGGTGNLAEKAPTAYGIARLLYTLKPRFQPLAADLVSIDPGSGSASARRTRLDTPVQP
jgi:predicted phosphodiesterase